MGAQPADTRPAPYDWPALYARNDERWRCDAGISQVRTMGARMPLCSSVNAEHGMLRLTRSTFTRPFGCFVVLTLLFSLRMCTKMLDFDTMPNEPSRPHWLFLQSVVARALEQPTPLLLMHHFFKKLCVRCGDQNTEALKGQITIKPLAQQNSAASCSTAWRATSEKIWLKIDF